jgi:Tol biopolymer transport system component
VTGAMLWRVATAPSDAPVTRFDVRPPDKTSLVLVGRPALALSPDGSMLAFVASAEGISRLYIRSLADIAARALPGTEGGSNPVFSPDGKEIAFYAAGRLKKATLDGTVTTVTEAGGDGDPRGITWLPDGSLVYASLAVGPLLHVPSTGGTPRPITTLDEKKSERTHRWPSALPGGKAVLFTIGTIASPDNYDRSTIEAVELATGQRHVVLKGASSARYVSTGHLLYTRESSLYAVPFDVDRLATQGSPVKILSGVNGDTTTGASHVSIAENGTLAYTPGSALAASNRLVWVDRKGLAQPLESPQGLYFDPQLSPDGTRAAVVWQTITAGSGDIWISDLSRKTFTRLSFSGNANSPVWSADGRTIYYVYIDPTGSKTTIMRKPADGSRDAESMVVLETRAFLKAVTADDAFAILDYANLSTAGRESDVVKLPLVANAKPERLVSSPFDDYAGVWSPDGRWLAYQSDESGRSEIYVRDVSGAGGRWQVSTTGGEEPRWSPDGRELFYRNETQMMAVSVDTRTTFAAKPPTRLFDGVYNLRSDTGVSYSVHPRADRFLMIRLTDEDATSSMVVVMNWFADLRRLMSAAPR